MGFIGELFQFFMARRKYWLFPVMIVLAVLGGLVVLTQGTAVAPFIYTLF